MPVRTRFLTIIAPLISVLLLAPSARAQTTWHVDDDAPNDPGPGDPTVSDPNEDGSVAHPFDAIQEAIDASGLLGDTVLVADGLYTGEGNRGLSFSLNWLDFRAINGPENCIIDCEGADRAFNLGSEASARIEGFTITNGQAEHGGAVYCYDNGATLSNCVITGCSATSGGAVYTGPFVCLRIENCTIRDNSAVVNGGGIYRAGSYGCPITNSVIVDNSAGDSGGGLCYEGDSGPVTNCTIAGNSAGGDGGGVYCLDNSDPTFANCILWDNVPEEIYADPNSNPEFDYCDIQGGYAEPRNIDVDPLFVDPNNGDYHIDICSPVINMGDPNYVPDPKETDIDGQDRVLNGRIDIGADEVLIVDVNGNGIDDGCEGCPQPGGSGGYCSADIYPNDGDGSWDPTQDGDCVIGIGDLGQLLPNYGATSGMTREDGDVYPATGGDGAVDIGDLGELLAQYADDCN
jgi:hypothetical protein